MPPPSSHVLMTPCVGGLTPGGEKTASTECVKSRWNAFQEWGNGLRDGCILQDKKNMFLTIKESIADVLRKLMQLCVDSKSMEGWAGSFEQ